MFKFIKIGLIFSFSASILYLNTACYSPTSMDQSIDVGAVDSLSYTSNTDAQIFEKETKFISENQTKEKEIDENNLEEIVKYSSNFTIGDYIKFGRYLNQDILWQVIAIENGNPVLFSNKILTLKAFSSSGDENNPCGPRADTRRNNRGSNFWATSTLRHWLNSSSNEGNVFTDYPYNPPKDKYLREGHNPYEKEAGFLSEFTPDEKKLIQPRTHKVLLADIDVHDEVNFKGQESHTYQWGQPNEALQNYDNAYYHKVTDHVFLLSIKELYEYVLSNEIDHKLKPTIMAIETSTIRPENLSSKSYWPYWLRTPSGSVSRRVRDIDAHGYVRDFDPFFSDRGIAPAISLVREIAPLSGNGTKDFPFILTN